MMAPGPGRRDERADGARRVSAAIATIFVAVMCRCLTTPPDAGAPPRSPEEAALRVFDLALIVEPEPGALARVIDGELIDNDRASALEAIASLGNASTPRVVSAVPLVGVDRTAIDVIAELPGGGSAHYSFQAEVRPDGDWRIVSIHGPGTDWPSRTESGTGLSVSAPAGESPR